MLIEILRAVSNKLVVKGRANYLKHNHLKQTCSHFRRSPVTYSLSHALSYYSLAVFPVPSAF